MCEDADLDAAVDGAMTATLRTIGQACTAANRFHVHAGVTEEFARRLTVRREAPTRSVAGRALAGISDFGQCGETGSTCTAIAVTGSFRRQNSMRFHCFLILT